MTLVFPSICAVNGGALSFRWKASNGYPRVAAPKAAIFLLSGQHFFGNGRSRDQHIC